MAPVIAWVEALIGRHVCVTFSIDVRDVNLAQRLQVGHSQSSHHAPPTLLTLVQRNHNGIVSDIISALHKLSERKFHPEIVSLFAPILKIPYLLCRFSLPSRASPSLHFGTKTPPDFSEPPNPLALSSVPIDPKVITRSIAPTCYSIFSTCVAPPASHLLQERCPKTSTAPPSSTTGPSFPAMSSTAALPSLCLKGRPPRGP